MAHGSTDRQVQSIRAFNRFYTGLLGLLRETLLDSPVSLTEARVLWEIRAHPHTRALDLMSSLGLDRGYLSRILRRLERERLVSRSAHGSDGRMRLLALTPAGTGFMRRLDAQASQQVWELIAPLSPAQRARLVRAMAEIRALLSPRRQTAPLRRAVRVRMIAQTRGGHAGSRSGLRG